MTNLAEADRVEVHILVDNAVDGLSSTPLNVENEWAFATRRGLRASSDRCLCCGVHGLSCLVTVQRGDVRHTLLFDSGPEEYAFERNTTRPALAHYGRAIANETMGNLNAAYRDYTAASRIAPEWREPRQELARFRVVSQ